MLAVFLLRNRPNKKLLRKFWTSGQVDSIIEWKSQSISDSNIELISQSISDSIAEWTSEANIVVGSFLVSRDHGGYFIMAETKKLHNLDSK